jgi:hypothetical protein
MLSSMVTRATPPDDPPPVRRVGVAPPAQPLEVPDRLEAAYWLMARVPAVPAVPALFTATRLYRAAWLAQLVAIVGGFVWLSASPQGLLPGATVGLATLGATMGGADPAWDDHRGRWAFPLRAPRTTTVVASALALLAALSGVGRVFAPWLACVAALGAAEAWRGVVADRVVRRLAAADPSALRDLRRAGIVTTRREATADFSGVGRDGPPAR